MLKHKNDLSRNVSSILCWAINIQHPDLKEDPNIMVDVVNNKDLRLQLCDRYLETDIDIVNHRIPLKEGEKQLKRAEVPAACPDQIEEIWTPTPGRVRPNAYPRIQFGNDRSVLIFSGGQ